MGFVFGGLNLNDARVIHSVSSSHALCKSPWTQQQPLNSRWHSSRCVMTITGSSTNQSGILGVIEQIETAVQSGLLPKTYAFIISEWYKTYQNAASQSGICEPNPKEYSERMFSTLISLVLKQIQEPYAFECYHQRVRSPFDYYAFGVQFARPIVNISASQLRGLDNLKKAQQQLKNGENVVFLANHQSEGDPHAVDVIIAELGEMQELAENIVFMAGDRVREDALVVPFSLGRNLLTVYSKKHINDVPELVETKQKHNRRTIKVTENMFKQGGVCLWFAPSGGRDRRSAETGKVEVAEFDPDAVEMMRFTALKSGTPTHFYPMSLATYALLPPPETVDKSLGERRTVQYTPLGLSIGNEIDWDRILEEGMPEPSSASELTPKARKLMERNVRAEVVTQSVREEYALINGYQQ
uniref:Phospholipid/glycerol acyltransferase domain-containing protein n=1 Tax=Timspurckia oligopyrenoides TaxID=708627 RepID=A0A7S0ZKR5_9RHOD|mmetsp:Transcript_8957/g.16138  ORF Transcript_8957/g.16138 Transcript_8957/m.16138 type:complete len:413 (+) Transcript_8957:84-1322(+)